MSLLTPALDPTPPRPDAPVPVPSCRLDVDIRVDAAHLANPLVAVQRLLASEAALMARVTGDDRRLRISVALPDASDETRSTALAWCRWAVHIAGIRGDVRAA